MKKLTFQELEETQEIMNSQQQSAILGGTGGISGGTGSSSDPYVITANYYTVGSIANVQGAKDQFGAGTFTVGEGANQKTYRYDINIVQKNNFADAREAANNDKVTFNGRTFGVGNVIQQGCALTSGGQEAWGSTSADNVITINTDYANSQFSGANANRSGYNGPSGLTQQQISANTIAHEMLHTMGLGDTNGTGNGTDQVNPAVNGANGKIVGFSSNSVTLADKQAMINGSVAVDGGAGNKIYR